MKDQFIYWNNAGKKGYANTYYFNRKVEKHNLTQVWDRALEAAKETGLTKKSKILELGCGDGMFAIRVLGDRFQKVEAHDYAPAAIARAKKNNHHKNVSFTVSDITKMKFSKTAKWDGVFLLGILHHVKSNTPDLVKKISHIADSVVVIDPNGNSPIRKAFELFIPAYKDAGEDSFRMEDLEKIFQDAGYRLVYKRYAGVVPWFTPQFLLPLMIWIEKWMQKSSIFNNFNSIVALGFKKKGR